MADRDEKDLEKVAQRVEAAHGYLHIDERAAELAKLDEEIAQPGFWDDASHAQSVSKQASVLRDTIAEYDEAAALLDDARAAFDLASEDELFAEEASAALDKLDELLDALEQVEGLRWIRLLYAYPERVSDEFIAAMARNKKVLPYLDLPIQHINSEILRSMNRKGDRETVLSAIRRLRAGIPNLTLRTTLITGYPGETQAQFEELCEFVKETGFDRLGCFAYSEEEGTPAARMEQLPQELREERAAQIMEIQAGIMARRQAEKVGAGLTVICDGLDEESGLYACRSMGDAPEIDAVVYVNSPDLPLEEGGFYRVRVEETDVYDLYACLEGRCEE